MQKSAQLSVQLESLLPAFVIDVSLWQLLPVIFNHKSLSVFKLQVK